MGRQWAQARGQAAATLKYITAAGAVSVIHFPSSRQILIMSRVFAVLFICYFIQTISAQEAEDDSSSNLLNKAGKLFNQHKSQLFSLIGLEEGKEEEFLTKTLEKMNIDSSSISQLTASFTDQESIKGLISTFSNPDKLPELLSQQTGTDQESINGFVQQVKAYIPSNGSSNLLTSLTSVMGILLVYLLK